MVPASYKPLQTLGLTIQPIHFLTFFIKNLLKNQHKKSKIQISSIFIKFPETTTHCLYHYAISFSPPPSTHRQQKQLTTTSSLPTTTMPPPHHHHQLPFIHSQPLHHLHHHLLFHVLIPDLPPSPSSSSSYNPENEIKPTNCKNKIWFCIYISKFR